jgi:hypothetical protein
MGHTLLLTTEEYIHNARSMGRIIGDNCPGICASVDGLPGSTVRGKYVSHAEFGLPEGYGTFWSIRRGVCAHDSR